MGSTDNRGVWERLAPWWDELAGEDGDEFHRAVVRPTTLDLLEVRPGERLLEIGCGNGGFARRLAGLGAAVVATDQAAAFIGAARSRSGPAVDYRVVDATDAVQLADLGSGTFDAAVANMVVMDMPEVVPLYRALMELLRPGGRFVFAVIHPCFGTAQPAPSPERARSVHGRVSAWAFRSIDRLSGAIPWPVRRRLFGGVGAIRAGKASLRYLESRHMRAQAVPGQPVAHWYFHRPLTDLLNPAFDAGLVLDRIAEPPFRSGDTAASLLAIRLRRPLGSAGPAADAVRRGDHPGR